jgi:energy-coupling factor transporter ATP-binding protein EcfA2
MKESFKYRGFKLIELKTLKHKILGTNDFLFLNQEDDLDGLYTTVIIGANGTGKSNLLRFIIEIFRTLKGLKLGEKRNFVNNEDFYLKFSLNGQIYEFTNAGRKFLDIKEIDLANQSLKSYTLLVNGFASQNYAQDIHLPLSIVAQSIMLTDKYPVLNKKEAEKFEEFNYLGLKNRPQQASTRSFERRTVEFIINNMHLDSFKDALHRITDFLEIENTVRIIFQTKNTSKFFWGQLTKEEFHKYYENIRKKYRDRISEAPFKLNYYLSLLEKSPKIIDELVDFCNILSVSNRLKKIDRSVSKLLFYELTDKYSHLLLKEDYKFIEHLRKLGLISNPDIKLYKPQSNVGFNLRSSSSGEFHFFFNYNWANRFYEK